MKTLFLLILSIVYSLTIYSANPPEENIINSFFKSKTYIVYEASLFSSYNFNIKDVVEKNWTVTEFELIQYEEFEKLRHDSKSSFLVLTNVQFTNDKTQTVYNFLNLVMGEKNKAISEMPDLVNIPLSIADQDEEIWVYKLTTLILFIQKHMIFLKDNPEMMSADFEKIYKKNTQSLEGITLYLLKEDLEKDINSIEKISKVYNGKIKLIEIQELADKIENKSLNIVFLHKVGSNTPMGNKICFKILLGVNDASIYYFNSHTISKHKPNLFLKEDFEKINNYQ